MRKLRTDTTRAKTTMMVGCILLLLLPLLHLTTTIHALSILDRREAMSTLATQLQTSIAVVGMTTLEDGEDLQNLATQTKKSPQGASTALLSVPRVGFSLYKTDMDQVERCVQIALQAGVRHFDVATMYGSNLEVGKALQQYISNGLIITPSSNQGDDYDDESRIRKQRLSSQQEQEQRRADLFVSHKVSNAEQSSNRRSVKTAVKKAVSQLKTRGYLDLVSIHSPLTDSFRRLSTYEAFLELQQEGIVRAVGVCHYGIGPLQELVQAGLPPPSVIQLVQSPFQQHKDIAGPGGWAEEHGSIVCCNAWSKLSSADGPQEGWAVLAGIAKVKGMTKAQVLVRWALQKGYLCVPRSGSKYKIDRAAIVENSFGGVQSFVLTPKEMEVLDGLDEQLPAGRLGIVDGWSEADIVDANWDPTTAV